MQRFLSSASMQSHCALTGVHGTWCGPAKRSQEAGMTGAPYSGETSARGSEQERGQGQGPEVSAGLCTCECVSHGAGY